MNGTGTDWIALLALLGGRWAEAYLVDLARYLIGVGIVVMVLAGPARRFSALHRIQQRRATARDRRRELARSLATVAVYATVALFTIEAIDRGWTRLYADAALHGWPWLLASVPLLLVAHDAYFYWAHRLMHQPRWFARMHRVHHLSRTPTPWAAYSFASGEALVMTLFVPAMLMLMPLHPGPLFVFLAIMILRNAMGHCGVEFHPVGWVDSPFDALTTVTHHDLHHQKFDGNYGLYFTWWDRWMGTELPGYKDAFRAAATPHDATTGTLAARSADAEVTS